MASIVEEDASRYDEKKMNLSGFGIFPQAGFVRLSEEAIVSMHLPITDFERPSIQLREEN